MSLENTESLINGAEVLAAGRMLGLSDDEAIAVKRAKQREAYERRSRGLENNSYREDPTYAETVEYERQFQKDKPQSAADVLGMSEYGSNEADLQQTSSGRVESIQAQDQSGLGQSNRDDKKFRGARRDNLPYRVSVNLDDSFETEGTPRGFTTGSVPVGERVPEELRQAAILQDAELTNQRRGALPYQVSRDGSKRRSFGVAQRNADGDVITERLNRVKRARPSGQVLNPEDIISIDKKPSARIARERRIGNDGPEEIRNPRNTSNRAQIGEGSAYQRLERAIESGQVAPTPENLRLLDRMLESADPRTAARNARFEGREAVRKANPVTEESLRRRAASRKKAEQDVIGLIASSGSTNEVIGENVMSEDSWKAKSTKPMPQLPVRAKADVISDAAVYQMVNEAGNVVGYSDGSNFVGEANVPNTAQALNAPTQSQQGLIDFIGQNLQQDAKGGDFDAQIGQSTQAFTDAASRLSPNQFGAGVENVPTGLRSFSEADRVIARLIERGEQNDASFSRFNEADPKKPLKVPAGEKPTVSDLLSTMKVDSKTKGELANALYMMALAEGSAVNAEGKERYANRQGSYQKVYRPEGRSGSVNLDLRSQGIAAVDLPEQNITFDSPAGRFYDGVEAAYVPNSQRARIDGQNINLQPALRNIENPDGSPVSPDSRAPFIGEVAGERTPNMPGTNTNYRYRKGFGPGVSTEQGYEDLERGMVKGKRRYSQNRVNQNVALANEIERRTTGMNEDIANRRVMQQANSASFDDTYRAEVAAGYQRDLDNQRAIKLNLSGGNPLNSGVAQPIQEQAVMPSIAPDPWAEPGPSRMVDAIQSERQSRQLALPPGRSSRELTPDLRRQLFALDGPKQGPEPNVEQMFGRTGDYKTPAGPGNAQGRIDRRISQMENIRTNPKYQNKRRIAYGVGSAAGLAGILGLSSDDEREEQY